MTYGPVVGLREVDLEVHAGELIAIIGASGAGKSSLLRGIMRLARTRGDIRFDGRDVTPLRPQALTRAGVALVPERRQIFPNLTVEENLLVGATSVPRRERAAAVDRVCKTFPLLAERRTQKAGTKVSKSVLGRQHCKPE